MSHVYIHEKFFMALDFLDPKKSEIDLSNEVLKIDFGQEAAKTSEVKFDGLRIICSLNLVTLCTT